MAQSIEMPELGESVAEGTVTQWLKEVGDKVEVDEPLLEVSTDKVDTEIPSPVAGTLLKIHAEEDDTVDVGDVIAEIGEEGEEPEGADDASDDSSDNAEDKSDDDSSEDDTDDSHDSGSEGSDDDSADSGDSEDVEMPELGESVAEGTITQWLKEVGDKVEVDEPLLEVSTDKVDTEIPSPISGTLVEILAEEDDTVDVGDIIARIGSGSAKPAEKTDDKEDKKAEEKPKADTKKSDDKSENKSDKKSEKKSSSDKAAEARKLAREESKREEAAAEADQGVSSTTSEPSGDSLPYVTPLVRKLAQKNNVDLSKVEGTGVGGRIRKQDVLAAADGDNVTTGAKTNLPAGPRASSHKVDQSKQKLRGTTQKVSRIREITAQTMLNSLQNSAQLTQVHEVDMSQIADLRADSKKAFQDKHGVNLTYMPFFAKAVVEALVSHPNVNASYNAETKEMTYHDSVNLSIAVDTEAGLLSPVIHDAQDMSLPELAKAIADVADRARNKKLKPNDLQGGTFTITNIGSEGALIDTPVLTPPQSALIGVGAIVKRPVVLSEDDNEAIAIREMVFLPMTYDHQVIDGADAGRFMSTLRDRLENNDFEEDLDL